MIVCGIDESGRGAVIGNLYVAIVCIDENDYDKIGKTIKKSWLKEHEGRLRIYNFCKKFIKFEYVTYATPREIDEYVVKGKLNKLIAEKAYELIREAVKNINDKIKVFVDSAHWDKFAFRKIIINLISKDVGIRERIETLYVDHKLDETNNVVILAEVVARICFNKHIQQLKKQLGIDIGSGYPSDYKTRTFLEKYRDKLHEFEFIRKSWSTIRYL